MKIVLASNNTSKLRELSDLLAPMGHELVRQADLNIDAAEETRQTFIENAIEKARHASARSGLPAIADDSGIAVHALDNAPGIFSARWSGEGATDSQNNRKLMQALQDQSDRTAHYYCALVFLSHAADPSPVIATGRWEGEITMEARGENGFGYDPYFFVAEKGVTAAELTAEDKHALSHRGQAVRELVRKLRRAGREIDRGARNRPRGARNRQPG